METLHRLAGVQDASDLSASQTDHSAHVADVPLPPIPITDAASRGSRASLPLSRRPSRKSIRSNRSGRSVRSSKHPSVAPSGSTNPAPYTALPTGYPRSSNPDASSFDPDALTDAPRPSQDSNHSRSSIVASNDGDGDGDGDGDDIANDTDEFVWGPTHPCFPHMNPHCLPSTPTHAATRVIRVKRDWLVAADLYPQYANLYPEILEPLVSDDEFRFLIANLNMRLREVFDPFTTRAWVDGLMGVLTGFLWDDLGLTQSKKRMRALEQFLLRWNAERVQLGKEVQVVLVRKTGFASLDFVVPASLMPLADGEEEDEEDDIHGRGDER